MDKTIKIFSLFFFLIYTSYVFRIAFPLIEYVVDYNYISEELCVEKDNPNNDCHGSCYLSKQIEREVNPVSKEKTVIIDFIKLPHLLAESELNILPQNSILEYFTFHNKIINYSSKPLTPPPESISFC